MGKLCQVRALESKHKYKGAKIKIKYFFGKPRGKNIVTSHSIFKKNIETLSIEAITANIFTRENMIENFRLITKLEKSRFH
jgi:hypothetical protein